MLTTTLNEICYHRPCLSGWRTLLRHLGPDFNMAKDFPISEILKDNPGDQEQAFDDTLWVLSRVAPRLAVAFTLHFVKRIKPVLLGAAAKDLKAAEDYFRGLGPLPYRAVTYIDCAEAWKAVRQTQDAVLAVGVWAPCSLALMNCRELGEPLDFMVEDLASALNSDEDLETVINSLLD